RSNRNTKQRTPDNTTAMSPKRKTCPELQAMLIRACTQNQILTSITKNLEQNVQLQREYITLLNNDQTQTEEEIKMMLSKLNDIQHVLDKGQELRQDLRDKHNALMVINVDYQKKVIEAKNQQARKALALKKNNTKGPPHRSAKLRDPDKLNDGENPSYESWKQAICTKLACDANCFPTEKKRMAYIRSRLGRRARQSICATHTRTGSRTPVTVEGLIKHLDCHFQEPVRRPKVEYIVLDD
ncbi:hypothetical protein E4U42_003003, partial [Claviceps africana]